MSEPPHAVTPVPWSPWATCMSRMAPRTMQSNGGDAPQRLVTRRECSISPTCWQSKGTATTPRTGTAALPTMAKPTPCTTWPAASHSMAKQRKRWNGTGGRQKTATPAPPRRCLALRPDTQTPPTPQTPSPQHQPVGRLLPPVPRGRHRQGGRQAVHRVPLPVPVVRVIVAKRPARSGCGSRWSPFGKPSASHCPYPEAFPREGRDRAAPSDAAEVAYIRPAASWTGIPLRWACHAPIYRRATQRHNEQASPRYLHEGE